MSKEKNTYKKLIDGCKKIGLPEDKMLELLAYTLKCKPDDIQSVFISDTEVNGFKQLFAALIEVLFNNMCDEDQIIREYTLDDIDELPYIGGTVDIAETIARGSLQRGRIAQSVSYKNYNTEINDVIEYCLMYSAKIMEAIRGKDKGIYNRTKSNYESVFDIEFDREFKRRSLQVPLDAQDIDYMTVLINKYTNGNLKYEFSDYQAILNMCRLLINDLGYTDGNEENSLNKISMENLMERATREICRDILINDIKSGTIPDDLTIDLNDPLFNNLRLDILIQFRSGDFSDIIIDVKTNEHLTNKTDTGKIYGKEKNIYQIFTYHEIYKQKKCGWHNKPDNRAAMFHYVDRKKFDRNDEKFNNQPVWRYRYNDKNTKSQNYSENNELLMYVYPLDENFSILELRITLKGIIEYMMKPLNKKESEE